ncbi:MAG: DNA topoisomerase [Candidatus Thorarchaeota archaeon]
MATLLIAEKNQAGRAIAEALGNIKLIKKSKNVSIYHVTSKDIYILPLRGHIQEHRNTPQYKSWTTTDPREIITNPKAIKRYKKTYAGPYVKALQEYAHLCDYCVIGTDADIEGCNIGFFDALPFVKKIKPNIKVSQLWLSTLQKSEILRKYNNLIKPKYSWGEAGEARALIDAFIGFSATREITNSLKDLLKKFNVMFTSIGRVQTSALYLLYLREKEILDFIHEKYFTIDANLIAGKDIFRAHHKNNPFKKKNMENAKQIYEKIKNEKIAIIENYNKNLVKRKPPTPLNTNKALILLTKNLKVRASTALNIMNDLYLDKIISYPRTDSDVYKSDFPHEDLIRNFKDHPDYRIYTQDLINKKRFVPTKGKKDAGDHPPITPLISLELRDAKLKTKLHKNVYNILARHYLALFGEDATESKQNLDLRIKDEPFQAQIVSIVDLGFLEIAPFLKPHYDTEIQITGNEIPVKNIELSEKETQPPPHYTDSTLLELMEKNNLGTKSTRPTIIEIMQKRKVIYKKGRRFFISNLGIFLIENLMKVWLPFLKPSFTREVETKLEMIKEEKKEMDDVINEVKKDFLNLFDKFRINKAEFIQNAKKYKIPESEQFPLTSAKCPFCNKVPMKYISLKGKRFFVCSDDNCKKYLSVPKKGRIKLLEASCSICNFNFIYVSVMKNKKFYNYYLCPNCWTEGLKDKNNDGKGFCSNCEDYRIINDQCVKK